MKPPFRVAVTGHRPNRLAIGEGRLARRLADVLAALRRGAHGRPRIALSALAEGADRVFAETALELGYRLEVLLPFVSADYETTFSDAATTPAYRTLLARAAQVRELPGRLDDSKAAYEAVGRATVEACDILVAVWDGAPAAGRGGTPEIIEHAIARGCPVLWVHAGRDGQPRLIRRNTALRDTPVPLARLAARAKPVTRARMRALAASLLPLNAPAA